MALPDGSGDRSPLDDPERWPALLDAIGPAWLLVAIRARMGPMLGNRYAAEDVLQEALLHAWRDRGRCVWQGLKPFRSWLLQIIDNRLRDLAEAESRHKRGGGALAIELPAEDDLPPGTTTPGRLAAWREQAEAMARALAALPDELREVVRLRLFDELEMQAVADRLGIGLSAAKHRLRKGSEVFRRAVRGLVSVSSSAAPIAD